MATTTIGTRRPEAPGRKAAAAEARSALEVVVPSPPPVIKTATVLRQLPGSASPGWNAAVRASLTIARNGESTVLASSRPAGSRNGPEGTRGGAKPLGSLER